MKILVLIFSYIVSLNAYDKVAHRGYYAYPENSKESVKFALQHGYDGVEIDIQPLKGGKDFALIHDAILQREVVSSYSKKNVSKLTKREWLSFYKKQNGVQTRYKTTTLKEILKVFQKNRRNKRQFLNIELKSPLVNIDRFYKVIRPYLHSYNIQISSNYLFLLQKLREKDKSIYLGYIFLPNAKNLKHKADEKVNGFLSRYHLPKINSFYEKQASKLEEKYTTKISQSYFNDFYHIETTIGSSMGVHIDFNDVKKYLLEVKNILKEHQLKIYVYSTDKDTTNSMIIQYFKKNHLHLDGIISNE